MLLCHRTSKFSPASQTDLRNVKLCITWNVLVSSVGITLVIEKDRWIQFEGRKRKFFSRLRNLLFYYLNRWQLDVEQVAKMPEFHNRSVKKNLKNFAHIFVTSFYLFGSGLWSDIPSVFGKYWHTKRCTRNHWIQIHVNWLLPPESAWTRKSCKHILELNADARKSTGEVLEKWVWGVSVPNSTKSIFSDHEK